LIHTPLSDRCHAHPSRTSMRVTLLISWNPGHHFANAVPGIRDVAAARNIQGVLDIVGVAHVREIPATVAVGGAHCILHILGTPDSQKIADVLCVLHAEMISDFLSAADVPGMRYRLGTVDIQVIPDVRSLREIQEIVNILDGVGIPGILDGLAALDLPDVREVQDCQDLQDVLDIHNLRGGGVVPRCLKLR